jgi:hypothetical protein
MRYRPWNLMLALAAVGLFVHGTTTALGARPTDPCRTAARAPAPGASQPDLPIVQSHSYRMAGRVRPFLFWITQKNVGSGLIVWRGGDGATAYELLIGTDPAIAPRGINRWGYIMEDLRAGATHVFAVMTTEEEARMSEVKGKATQGAAARGRFKAIDARVDGGAVCAATDTFDTERDFALQDVSGLVQDTRQRLTTVAAYDGVVAAGTRPGFLSAVDELMKDTIAARRSGDSALARLRGRTIGYVHGRFLLDMSLLEVQPADVTGLPAGIAKQAPVHASFEARSRATGQRYRFELDYPTTGPMAGVPLVIRYQPRWWLQVELTLEADATSAAALQRTGAMRKAWEHAVR